ncbi:unnamed protein product [Gordionus sp. m RMFG-2023]
MNTQPPNCRFLFDIFAFDPRYINIYKYWGSTLFTLGVIGNMVGMIVASSLNKHHVRLLFKKFNSNAIMPLDGHSTQKRMSARILSQKHMGGVIHANEIANRSRQAQNSSQQTYKRKKRINANQYLLKWFFAVNLVNVIWSLGVRLLEIFEIVRVIRIYTDPKQDRSISSSWVDDYPWNFYASKIHFPLTNPFITLGFLIYVLFFLSQMIAVKYPFSYKRIYTLKYLRIMIAICFIYGLVWYIPTFNWLKIVIIPICPYKSRDNIIQGFVKNDSHGIKFQKPQFPINLSNPILFYSYRINQVDAPIFKELWVTYQVCRELFTKVFPFIAIIIFKMMALRRTNRLVTKTDYGISFTTTITVFDSYKGSPNTQVEAQNDGQNYLGEMESKSIGIGIQESSRYQQKIMKERKQHLRTMLILTIEFLVLLLPISISQILNDILLFKYRSKEILIWYTIFNMLEFVYISCTFYINFIFNPIYRSYVIMRFQRLLI